MFNFIKQIHIALYRNRKCASYFRLRIGLTRNIFLLDGLDATFCKNLARRLKNTYSNAKITHIFFSQNRNLLKMAKYGRPLMHGVRFIAKLLIFFFFFLFMRNESINNQGVKLKNYKF